MTVKDRYEGIQTVLDVCGDSGCHFLVLLTIIEEWRVRHGWNNPNVDLIEAVRISRSKGWLRDGFWVHDADKILGYFTGKKWTRSDKLAQLPVIKENQWTECNWYNPRTKKEHFTRRAIDTLEKSVTVKEGYIRYYYVYTCEE